jgi:hypothetical protein
LAFFRLMMNSNFDGCSTGCELQGFRNLRRAAISSVLIRGEATIKRGQQYPTETV